MMRERIMTWLPAALFTLGGALLGLGYYYLAGCATGSCPITSSTYSTMAYMGVIGWLLSGMLKKKKKDTVRS